MSSESVAAHEAGSGLVFGPVPSRRLGQSLGVNNVPLKTCSYSCVYCQLGPTRRLEIERHAFHAPETLATAVRGRVEALRARDEAIDYLSFVPDGEPTLDVALGLTIDRLRPLGIPIAVMTNASLLWKPDVRTDLERADWVSLKVDAVREDVWRRHNRPDPRLSLAQVLDGMRRFAASFGGMLVTETMLVRGLNDADSVLAETADFVATLAPRIAYLGIPTRPPGEPWVEAPGEQVLVRAYATFEARLARVELLTGYPEPRLGSTGDAVAELLAITAVHPLRQREVDALLAKAGAGQAVLDDLLRRGALRPVSHRGERFYVRSGLSG